MAAHDSERDIESDVRFVSETAPLLPKQTTATQSWWRTPSPGKLMPFVLLASLARGLTLSPRVDVFTHLACSAIRHEQTVFTPYSTLTTTPAGFGVATSTLSYVIPIADFFERNPLPHTGPSKFCLSDPKVQAAAANLQTVMNTTIGVLSALTSGFWGGLGDRWGRKWVLWLVVFGIMSQDLVFLFCALYGTQLHLGHYTLIVGAISEGALGSWATFSATMNAYLSDCSSATSRAKKFARFAGVFYAGISLGPALGSFALRHLGLPTIGLFYIAVAANSVALLYVPALLPESRVEVKEPLASSTTGPTVLESEASSSSSAPPTPPSTSPKPKPSAPWYSSFNSIFHPLGLLTPRRNHLRDGHPRVPEWDVDLTLLALASFCSFLLAGFAPNKYLYAEHVFGWDAAQLGIYITIAASSRALWLIVALPVLIKFFKPKSPKPVTNPAQIASLTPAERRALLLPALKFDLRVARLSVLVDALSYVLTAFAGNGALFTALSTLTSFGGGMGPASQSVMLALMADGAPAAVSADGDGDGEGADEGSGEIGIGGMFGAISMLQAIGQNIIGPILFGAIYASTVATFPQAIFVAGAALLGTALLALLFVAPHRKVAPHLRKAVRSKSGYSTSSQQPLSPGNFTGSPGGSRQGGRRKRGRSRTAKDLRAPLPSSPRHYHYHQSQSQNELSPSDEVVSSLDDGATVVGSASDASSPIVQEPKSSV